MESVTVPAGTFNAYRFESVVTWTTGGQTTTETIQRWVKADPAQQVTLKVTMDYAYSGAQPASGALVSEVRMLQSVTN